VRDVRPSAAGDAKEIRPVFLLAIRIGHAAHVACVAAVAAAKIRGSGFHHSTRAPHSFALKAAQRAAFPAADHEHVI